MTIAARSILLVVLWVAAPVATAQLAPLPMPPGPTAIPPESGGPPPGLDSARVVDADDRSLERFPDHPPFGEVPPMPMPSGDGWVPDPAASRGASEHDADRRLTVRLSEVGWMSGRSGGSSPEPNYRGIGEGAGHGDSGGADARGFGTMVVAGDLPGWPRRANVKLFMRFTTQASTTVWFTCSGSMADAGVVQTAAHCVYARNPNGINIFNWADEIWIYPAWNGVGSEWTAPGTEEVIQHFGYARGTAFMAGTAYIDDGNFDRDAGVIRISRATSRSVGMLTGWFGWTWGYDCAWAQSRTYYNFSYPSENCGGGLHTGRTMYFWSGTWDSCPGNQLALVTTAGCLTAVWGGMSGSAAYHVDGDNRNVHAVCSNSNRTTSGRYAKLWEQWVTDRTNFTNTTRGTTFDLEALQFRLPNPNGVAGAAMPAGGSVLIANATNHDPPSRGYTLRVYLSTNNVISSGDTLLATWSYTYDFVPMQGVNFLVPAPVIPAATAAGSYWIGVILDPATDGTSANNDSSVWDAQPVTIRGQLIFANSFEG